LNITTKSNKKLKNFILIIQLTRHHYDMLYLDKVQYLNKIQIFFSFNYSLKFILLCIISQRGPLKPLGHVHVLTIGSQTPSFKHAAPAQNGTKIFKS
jgi:hypothetical protein